MLSTIPTILTMSKTIARQIIELEHKSSIELREIYNQLMPEKCAANACKEFLRPRIAYRLQELAFGSLAEERRKKLLEIIEKNPPNLRNHTELMPGTKICREWGGEMHEVEVLKQSFLYQGQKFRSLSSIARRITGSSWNGLRFFKLKS